MPESGCERGAGTHRNCDDGTGYFLSEDGQFRLVRLGEFVTFLARLAQPRSVAEEREAAPTVRAGELAVCMELLAEQLHLVLREVSWPALRVSAAQAQANGAARDGAD
ncbi:XAC0095 family protein [Xanthomonas sacchari]|uniref:XAC0095 family protein n=1 Tax=Xanthomonas sacchari TaxID=56458 RepID=UPI003529C7A1